MFTDETIISQYRSFQPHVRRPPGHRFDPQFTCSTVRSAPTVMIWCEISGNSGCGLSTVKAENYLEVLKSKVEPFMIIRGTSILQQDGAPAHNSRLITNWISQQSFDLLHGWAGNSPYLNYIENYWATLKNKLQTIYSCVCCYH